jgi:hypothetical protein
VLTLARLDAVDDAGCRQRELLTENTRTLLPVEVARVAAPAEPRVPRPLGMRKDDFAPLEVAPDTIVLGIPPQFRTSHPVLLVQWLRAVVTTPCPYRFHQPP